MGDLLVSNNIYFTRIRSCNNLGQVTITVPVFILLLNPIHHGLSFSSLIYFKPNLLLISGFHHASLLLVTFINRLMH